MTTIYKNHSEKLFLILAVNSTTFPVQSKSLEDLGWVREGKTKGYEKTSIKALGLNKKSLGMNKPKAVKPAPEEVIKENPLVVLERLIESNTLGSRVSILNHELQLNIQLRTSSENGVKKLRQLLENGWDWGYNAGYAKAPLKTVLSNN